MATNPNPDRITAEMWRFWEQFKVIEPSVLLGGIYANKSGYHNTRNANSSTNYSVRELEDKGGPGDKAAAIDLTFPDAQRGDYKTISLYCKRLMASSKDPNDHRLDGWREWYGQTDTDSHVEGWDTRHDVSITSDSSHLWHIHMSHDRDSIAVWVTYDGALSVLKGETLEDWNRRTQPVPQPPKPTPTHAPGSRVLKFTLPRLMNGADVRFVQRWIGPEWCGKADGVFGLKTMAGVKKYQRMRGITADGIVGRATWAQMGVRLK